MDDAKNYELANFEPVADSELFVFRNQWRLGEPFIPGIVLLTALKVFEAPGFVWGALVLLWLLYALMWGWGSYKTKWMIMMRHKQTGLYVLLEKPDAK